MSLTFQEKQASLNGDRACLRGLERAHAIALKLVNHLDEQGNHPEMLGAKEVADALARSIAGIKDALESSRPPCPGCKYIDDESGLTPPAHHYTDCEIVR